MKSIKKLINTRYKFFYIFIIILIFNLGLQSFLFFDYFYNKYYHWGEISIEKYKDTAQYDLFSEYKPHIDTKNIPKTYKEYQNIDNKNEKVFYYTYDYQNINDRKPEGEEKARLEFIKSLKDNKSFNDIRPQLYYYGVYKLFYDKSGELLFIEYEKNYNNYYRYDISGKLLEAEWYNCNEVNIVFSPDEQLKYYFYRGEAFPFFKFHISYKSYVIKIFKEILLSSVIIFLLYLLYYFCKINNFPKGIDKDYLKKIQFENKNKKFSLFRNCIIKAKSYFISQGTMLYGWIISLLFLSNLIPQNQEVAFYLLGTYILSILLFQCLIFFVILDIIFYNKLKIKWEFIYENPFYNIIWFIGQTITLIYISLVIIPIFIFNQSLF